MADPRSKTRRHCGVTIEAAAHPDGQRYRVVSLDGERLGSFEVVEGGFLAWGCFKPCATEAEAVAKLLKRQLARLRAEAAKIEAALRDGAQTEVRSDG